MTCLGTLTQNMAHKLSWKLPGQVMTLNINGHYAIDEAQAINQIITDELEKTSGGLMLVIDASDMKRPVNFEMIRASQTFMDHEKLTMLIVVAKDKLIRLSLMVIFNLTKAKFVMAVSHDHIQKLFRSYGQN